MTNTVNVNLKIVGVYAGTSIYQNNQHPNATNTISFTVPVGTTLGTILDTLKKNPTLGSNLKYFDYETITISDPKPRQFVSGFTVQYDKPMKSRSGKIIPSNQSFQLKAGKSKYEFIPHDGGAKQEEIIETVWQYYVTGDTPSGAVEIPMKAETSFTEYTFPPQSGNPGQPIPSQSFTVTWRLVSIIGLPSAA